MPQARTIAVSTRPLGLLVAAGLTPLIVLATIFIIVWINSQGDALEREAMDRTEAIAVLLDQQLKAEMSAIEMVAQTPALDGPNPDFTRIEMLGARILNHQPLWRGLGVSNADGMRLIEVPRGIGGPPGKVRDMASFKRALATGKPVIGDVISTVRGDHAFAIRAPVVREGQPIRYLVGAGVEPEAIRRLLLRRHLPAGWDASILDGTGRVVATTDKRLKVGAVAPRAEPSRRLENGLQEIDREDQDPLVAATRPVAGVQWSVRVTMPMLVFAAPLARSLMTLVLGSLLTLLLAGWFLWLYFRDANKRAVTDAALAQSQRLEALGKMTGGVAHDFNNLLTPIVGTLDLLRRKAEDPRSSRMIEGALASAERARTLIARLLAFARRQQLDTRDVSIKQLLEGMSDLLERSIGPSIRLVINTPERDVTARVDPNQLELALLNLAVNARDAMPGGGMLTITAAAEQVEDAQHPAAIAPGHYVRLSVIDTGAGMDAATAKRAIEPFFSTKTDGRGTGLGLSMVHGLAAQSGGGLMIASQPGLGTRIEMWLPAGGEADGAEEAETPMPASVRPLSILLVDDEDLVRAATADMLTEAGHRVDEAQSGAAALHMFDQNDYDLVVTDFAMPGMSGAELVAKLRERAPGLAALLVTGYASATELPSDLPRLNKPFRSADLLARIESIASEDKIIRFPKEAKG